MNQHAHAFRGEFIDVCAQVEQWTLKVIKHADPGGKPPYLFGLKLKRVGEIATTGTLFSKPARVCDLLDQLKPLAELRSQLAHAVVQTPSQGSDPIFAWEVAAPDGNRFWLKQSEMSSLLGDLKKIRKELTDQKLTDPAAIAPSSQLAPPCSGSVTGRAVDISTPSRS